jgi:glycosyltransferase involved in cell wall biosynthesis
MRIAQISTLATPVSRDGSGSIEMLTWLLTRELAGLGHEVTVFGIGGSEVDGELVATLPGRYGSPGTFDDWQLCEWVNLCRAVEQSGRFDVLHSHAYLWGMPLQPLSHSPLVHTLHIVPDDNAARLRGMFPNACVTAVSRHQWSAYPHLPAAPVVPHGVDVSQFTFCENPDDYVCFLGRFVSGKGPLEAIAAARTLGLKIILAGPANTFFENHVKQLVDGVSVQYIGSVNNKQRDKLLGSARALIYPVQHPEPFGLVLVEAMLCGTPVAAMRLGAVPEIVDESVTGCTGATAAEFLDAIKRCLSLDRRQVRQHAERRFSVKRMVEGYLAVYDQAIRAAKSL